MSSSEEPMLLAIFERSRNPMLLADDDRWFVNVNRAACELLGHEREVMLSMRVDDITPMTHREGLDHLWGAFLERGGAIGSFPVLCADGSLVNAEFNATANIVPNLHLSIFINPLVSGHAHVLDADEAPAGARSEPVAALRSPAGIVLTADERTVISLLALGQDWHEIADDLEISVTEVRAFTRSSIDKLGARTLAHAVSIAIRAGEITPGADA